ncbi:MAG: SDR family oxidoreductase, partial [Acetobacteraceae bacterium]|nr:SDR family oxidoreductase [Acetobacteraceae bacterium]
AGVGRAVAQVLAREGWNLGLIARNAERLEAARHEAEELGAKAIALPADVADAQAVSAAADKAAETFGGIDLWVNAAMATVFAPVHEIAPEEFRRVTEVTYLGQVHGTLAALRNMRPRDRGTIVQVGSALAYRSIPLQSAYCAAKFAIRGFTDSLRSELIHEGSRVRLTMVQFPAVNTPQFDWARARMPRQPQPVPPIHQPEAVARHILRAAWEAPRELWLGWPSVRAILGGMLAPGLTDRLAARAAWDGQMTQEPARPRGGNLFETVPRQQGSHGRFDARARCRVAGYDPVWLRGALAALAVAAPALAWRLGRRAGTPARLR